MKSNANVYDFECWIFWISVMAASSYGGAVLRHMVAASPFKSFELRKPYHVLIKYTQSLDNRLKWAQNNREWEIML